MRPSPERRRSAGEEAGEWVAFYEKCRQSDC